MKVTNIYITCESANLVPLRKAAELIALQKGCDPVRVRWPSGAKESELRFCQKQFHQIVTSCDMFVAIVDDKYGGLRLESPHSSERISAMHFEILEALNLHDHRPEMKIFALSARRDPGVQKMLDSAGSHIVKYETDKQFRNTFSSQLTEYRQGVLTGYLAGLHRLKISVTCRDRRGLLADATQVVNDLNGNLAGGTQTTRGTLAILHFVAEWTNETYPETDTIRRSMRSALPEVSDDDIKVERLGTGEPEIRTLISFLITFVDQPGIADHVFSLINSQNVSVLNTQIETFLSGGMMIGRIHFSLNGDNFSSGNLSLLAKKLRKLPGILHVDSAALHGRYWS